MVAYNEVVDVSPPDDGQLSGDSTDDPHHSNGENHHQVLVTGPNEGVIINDDGNSESSFEDDDLDDVDGVDHFSVQSEVDNLVEVDFEDDSVEEDNFNFNEEPNGHVFSDDIFQKIKK